MDQGLVVIPDLHCPHCNLDCAGCFANCDRSVTSVQVILNHAVLCMHSTSCPALNEAQVSLPGCMLTAHVVVGDAVGCKVPADLRLTQVLSSIIRLDQVGPAPPACVASVTSMCITTIGVSMTTVLLKQQGHNTLPAIALPCFICSFSTYWTAQLGT